MLIYRNPFLCVHQSHKIRKIAWHSLGTDREMVLLQQCWEECFFCGVGTCRLFCSYNSNRSWNKTQGEGSCSKKTTICSPSISNFIYNRFGVHFLCDSVYSVRGLCWSAFSCFRGVCQTIRHDDAWCCTLKIRSLVDYIVHGLQDFRTFNVWKDVPL